MMTRRTFPTVAVGPPLADVNEVRAREGKTNLAPSATIYADFKLREDRPASCSCRRCCRRFHPGGILPAASIIGFITLFGIDT